MRREVSTADTAGNPTTPSPHEGAVELLTAPDLAGYLPKLEDLGRETRRALLQAGREVLECRRVLSKVGLIFEDRTLEITGLLPISVDRLLAALAEST